AFDLTVTSVYAPLVTGGRAVIYRKDGPETPILKIVEDNQVDVVKLTPSHLSLIKEMDCSASRIKRLIVGGEALETELALRAHECFGGEVEIINEYGPTEATVGCMIYRYDAARDRRATVPIGLPAANAEIYVMDELRREVGAGIIGEIYI